MGTTYKELFKLYDLIQCGDSSSVDKFLTENTVEINSLLPCKGIGILHLAVGIDPLDKSKKCTEIILKHGGDPNLCTEDWLTPVHIAAIWGRVDNLKLLIGCGGDPSKQDIEGHSAFDYAAREQQWEVYDYLHNVVDESNDSLESQCAYTLNLERILVTTDQMVAEYEPVTENHLSHTHCRKSEMIRDWCDKNSLVINKLYPTILGDTYLLENESAPWRSIDFTKNSTTDLTKDINMNHDKINETDLSFETCFSKKLSSNGNFEISGVKPLEKSAEETEHLCSCDISNSNYNLQKQHLSIYENFSLPSSPNSIIHRNYNSKSTLKKKLNKECSQNSKVKEKWTLNDPCSLLIDDHSEVDSDKALAVVQNKTNEWLSTNGKNSDCRETDVKMFNTRRSSASSGVSSNFSGGSIALANIQEEYKYKDKIENVILIEKRLLVSPIVLPVDETCDEHDHTVLSVASSLPKSVEYDVETLRVELTKLGFKPGPIQENNKTLYLKKLHSLKKNTPENGYVIQNLLTVNREKGNSVELGKSLRTDEWMKNLSPYIELESKARTDFSSSNKKWREGTAKTSFTYLLLDPRLTGNLPAKAGNQSNHVSWITFINSIFYVGKGKRSRPYSHLYQALTLWKSNFTRSPDKKVQHILDIWSDKVGVVCLHIFQNVIPAEAYTYEAAMIDALGVNNLKNLKSGNYYGVVASWPLKERRMLGLYLLYKAMLIFINEGERQLRPDDID